MSRTRIHQTSDLAQRLADEAERLRMMAKDTHCPIEQNSLLQRAHEYESAKHMEGWLRSAELRPPEKP